MEQVLKWKVGYLDITREDNGSEGWGVKGESEERTSTHRTAVGSPPLIQTSIAKAWINDATVSLGLDEVFKYNLKITVLI